MTIPQATTYSVNLNAGHRPCWVIVGVLMVVTFGCSSAAVLDTHDAGALDERERTGESGLSEASDAPAEVTLHCPAPLSCRHADGCTLTGARMEGPAACANVVTDAYLESQCADGTIGITHVVENRRQDLYFREGQLVAVVDIGFGERYSCVQGPDTFTVPTGCPFTRDFCAEAEDGGAGSDAAD